MCLYSLEMDSIRITQAPSSYGSLEYNFQDDVSDFKCSVCSGVAKDAVWTDCCDSNFCEACINAEAPCPTCKLAPANYKIVQDRKQQMKILALRGACTGKECDWKGTLSEFITHSESCSKIKVKCPYPKCYSKILRSSVEKHKASCGRRPYTCPHCKRYEGTYSNVIKSHVPTCPYAPSSSQQQPEAHAAKKTVIQQSSPMKVQTVQEISVQNVAEPQPVSKSKPPAPKKLQLEERIKNLEARVDSVSAELDTLASFVLVLPVSFTIENYTSLKLSRQHWEDIPTLYTHRNGYKLKLSMQFEEDGLFIEVANTRGSNDSHLHWPLEMTLKVEIINQAEGASSTLSRSVSVALNLGEKCSKFITTYSPISTSTSKVLYVKNNSLQLKIDVARN